MTPLFAALLDALDERLRVRGPARHALGKVFPHHWSFLLGEVAVLAFVLLVATGVFLTMFYAPSIEPVTYQGDMALYEGRQLPAAFESVVRLSHDVPGGLFFRRLHRGAAYVFVTAIALHLLRILLTGAFRRPREVNYHVGLTLLALALALAVTGQSLPYDMVEGAALRIAYSFLLSLPFVGEQVAFWVFGGDFFGAAIPRFFVAHILVLPGALAALLTVHLLVVARQGHTQFARRDADTDGEVVGPPLWPTQFGISTGLALAVAAALATFAVLVPWSDVALHGPAVPGHAPSAAHPDLWLLWMEGALVLFPAWEWYPVPGVVVSGPLVAGVLLPLGVFGALAAYPFLDRRMTGRHGDVHTLDHPRDVPLRTGFACAIAAFVVLLTIAGLADYLARGTGVPVERVIVTLRGAVLAGPLVAGYLGVVAARRARVRHGRG